MKRETMKRLSVRSLCCVMSIALWFAGCREDGNNEESDGCVEGCVERCETQAYQCELLCGDDEYCWIGCGDDLDRCYNTCGNCWEPRPCTGDDCYSNTPEDHDGDGFAVADDCDDSNADVNPAAHEITYDGVDNDCSPETLDDDLDGDGFELANDCDDTDSAISPGVSEICDEGIDNDCDGQIDENDAIDAPTWYADDDSDGYGASDVTQEACAQSAGYVENDEDCDDSDAAVNPDAFEVPYDGVDNDCSSATLDFDLDGDGFALADDCDDSNAAINPGASEVCDEGIDNDCDGEVDENDAVDAPVWYVDDDDDGFGDVAVVQRACAQPAGYVENNEDCDDSDVELNPLASEVCDDGMDNDCDGETDEEEDADEDLFTNCGTYTVNGASILEDCHDKDPAIGPYSFNETCGDGVDQDCDGEDPDCDSWRSTTLTNAPNPREGHFAVWTGEQMIIWGGNANGPPAGDGGVYDPNLDRWTTVSSINEPNYFISTNGAAWTGEQLIVWGGELNDGAGDGGMYDPLTNIWTPITTTEAPVGRMRNSVAWADGVMIVWGGDIDRDPTNTGGVYDPTTDSWTPTATTDAPSARLQHTAVWTGDRMIIWGGWEGMGLDNVNTGALYDPVTNGWTPTSMVGVPSGRNFHTAVWTGDRMIVWGGVDGSTHFTNGAIYNPDTDTWSPISTDGCPGDRVYHRALWTGDRMIVWGGYNDSDGFRPVNDGGIYDPDTDSWTLIGTEDAPVGRFNHTIVWTGDRMIVWGGGVGLNDQTDTGGVYFLP